MIIDSREKIFNSRYIQMNNTIAYHLSKNNNRGNIKIKFEKPLLYGP